MPTSGSASAEVQLHQWLEEAGFGRFAVIEMMLPIMLA
jgi:hypothetical protein